RHDLCRPASNRFGDWPAISRSLTKIDRQGTDVSFSLNASGTREPQALSIDVDQVQQREWNFLLMGRKRLRRKGAGLIDARRLPDTCAEIAKRGHATLGDDFGGDLVNRREHAADAAVGGVVTDGTVGDGEVRLLDESVTIELELNILVPRRRSTTK